MSDLTCPYCETGLDVPDDCYEPNQPYECECSNCNQVFQFTIEYWPSYTEHKTPCLNGEPHDWKPFKSYEFNYLNRRRCSYCSEEKTLGEPGYVEVTE